MISRSELTSSRARPTVSIKAVIVAAHERPHLYECSGSARYAFISSAVIEPVPGSITLRREVSTQLSPTSIDYEVPTLSCPGSDRCNAPHNRRFSFSRSRSALRRLLAFDETRKKVDVRENGPNQLISSWSAAGEVAAQELGPGYFSRRMRVKRRHFSLASGTSG